jgi:hypothetical protein
MPKAYRIQGFTQSKDKNDHLSKGIPFETGSERRFDDG